MNSLRDQLIEIQTTAAQQGGYTIENITDLQIEAIRSYNKEVNTTLVDIGAIPETTDYANGWNAARQEVFEKIKKPLIKRQEELLGEPKTFKEEWAETRMK